MLYNIKNEAKSKE